MRWRGQGPAMCPNVTRQDSHRLGDGAALDFPAGEAGTTKIIQSTSILILLCYVTVLHNFTWQYQILVLQHLGCIDIRFSHSTSLYSESHPFPWANLAPNIDSSGSEYLQSLGRHSPVTLHLTSVTSGDLHLRSALSQVLHLLLTCFPWFIMAHHGSSTAMHLVEESDRRWPPPPQSDAIISYTESYRDSNITIVTWVNWKGKETRKWTQ